MNRKQETVDVTQLENSMHGTHFQNAWKLVLKLVSFALIGFFVFFSTAFANPQGGVVVGGSATITQSPGFTQINQSTDKAIIDWRTFNIGVGEHTNFSQPSSSSIALNRINAAYGASQILGKLTANGQVWLINPAGIFFGKTAQVDVAGLVATTANIKNEDFMAGNYKFQQTAGFNAGIVNEGTIRAADNGLVAIVAPAVVNRGKIVANMGKVALAAGTVYTLDMYGDQLIHFGSNPEITARGIDPRSGRALPDAILNAGKIIANGGSVQMTARTAKGIVDNAINMKGIVEARTAYHRKGEIILAGGDEGIVRVSGRLDASGKAPGQTGGKIQITGQKVGLFKKAVVNASGDVGGGEILIGGDYQGKNPLVKNAQATYIGPKAVIKANALTKGDGGKVIVWADDATQFYGTILAQGGPEGGNGGFVETSGKEFLHVGEGSRVDTRAPMGKTGLWLLDPRNIIVANGGGGTLVQLNPFSSGVGSTITIDPATINAAVSNVLMQANNDITFTNAISMSNVGVGITAQAGRDININNSITTIGGAITLSANDSAAQSGDRAAGTGDITTTGAGTTLDSGGAAINLSVGQTTGSFSAGSITLNNLTSSGGIITVNSPNVLTLNGAINSGAGQVNLSANTDGSGANNFTMAAGSSITTTNAPVTINVNTASGGTGNAGLRTINTGGGILTVATDTGNNATGTAITQSAGTTLTTGAASFSTGNGAITLTQANDFTGAVTLNTRGANSVSITDANNLTLGVSSIGVGGTANLTVNATGNIINDGPITVTGALTENTANSGAITQTNPLTITGTSTFVAGAANDITLNNASNNFGTVAITSGKNVTLRDSGALNFAASTISGNLDVTTSGLISQTGALNVSAGTATFTAGTGNNITLNTATNNFNIVAITSGNDVSLRDTNALVLGALSISGNLTIQTGGALTQIGAVNMLNAASTTTLIAGAGNNITLTDPSNNFHNLVITSGNTVSIRDSDALNFGAATSTISGALNVITNGAISQTGPLTVSGITTLEAGAANDITLMNASNNFSSVGITSGHNILLNDTNALTLNASSISGTLGATSTTGMTIAGAINADGSINLQANSGGAGANTFTMNAGSSITSNTGDVIINVNTAGGGTGGATIRDITASLGAITIGTGTTTGGTLTQSAGTTLLSANTITLNSPNAMTLSGTTHTTGLGSIIINSNTDGAGANNFSSSAGTLISDNGNIDITANAAGGTGAATFGNVSAITGAVTISSGSTTGGTLTQSAGTLLTALGNIILHSPNAITLSGTTLGGAGISIDTNTDGAGANNFSMGALSSITANNNVDINVNAAGGGTGTASFRDITAGGIVTIRTNTGGNLTGGTVTQTSGILSGAGINLISPNAVVLNSTTNSTGVVNIEANKDHAGGQDFTMAAGSSITTFGNAVNINVNDALGGTGNAALRNIDTNGGTLTVATDTGGNSTGSTITQSGGTTLNVGAANFSTGNGAITLTQANDFTGPVTLTTTGANSASITDVNNLTLGNSTVGGNLTVVASGDITNNGLVTANQQISLNALGGSLIINAPITGTGSGTITLSGANGINLNAGVNSASGDQIYNNDITLGASVSLIGNNITFNSTINGNQDLTLNAGSLGNIIFNGDVGNITGLNLLTIANANDVTNNAVMNVTSFLQLAGSGLTSLGAGGLNAINSSVFITNDVTGNIMTGSLALDTNAANLTGTVAGLSGQAGADQIVVLNSISLGTHFFDGIDLAQVSPPPVVPALVVPIDELAGLRDILIDQDPALRSPSHVLSTKKKKICTGLGDCLEITIKKVPPNNIEIIKVLPNNIEIILDKKSS